jgi:putative CocE/NonD family hydrolase
MRDGTILRADVHRPDHGGPYPVLVQRTPYGKDGNFNRFVKAGYIVVSQDVRGRHESEGKFESFDRLKTHDAEDGFDTIEWAAKLAGSNGKVGTFGISYLGFLQWRLAPLRPLSLAAMSASGIDAREFLCEVGAMPGSGLRFWVVMMAPEMRRRANRPGVHSSWEAMKLWQKGESEKWLNFLPRLKLPKEIFEDEDDVVKRILQDPSTDSWKLDEGCKDVSVPNLEIAGWYDHAKGDLALYKAIVKEGKTEVARSGSRIIIGPWTHGTGQRKYGDIDFGPDAVLNRIDVQVRWFDYWLKGKQNGVDKDPPVRIFVMGDNKWRDEQHWPPRNAKEKILFITSDGHANTSSGDGKLLTYKPKQSGTDHYVYDPKNPVPSLANGSFMPSDRRQLADRQDILVYETKLLTERIEVTGNPIVELYAASSASDTDWYVWLIDVAPDGLAREVSVGKIRARYRDGFDKPKLIKPGEVIQYIIRMNPTSNAFLPGHRIRLDITSSDFPHYDRNHNTEANPNVEATFVVANQTICHGTEQATHIILPWVPNVTEEEKPAEDQRLEAEAKKKMYPFHQAVANGDIEQVKRLIATGADVKENDDEERTPLCYAVEAGKMELVQLLVEAGADVNAGSWPPLFVAIDGDNTAIAKYLIDHGANINAGGSWPALMEALYASSIEMIGLLISRGADINVKDEDGMPALYSAFFTGKEGVAKLLLEKGADFAWKDKAGRKSLHYTALEDYSGVAELLLVKGAKIDERDGEYNFTPLHYAARFGSTKVVEVLIAHGADIKAKDKWGYQPIHWAAYHDRPEIIELLTAKGADVNAKTSLGQTPLQLAIPKRNTASIEMLRKHGAKE